MAENGKIALKWTYTPIDFFEVKETDLLPDYDHTIDNGNITVSMDLNEFNSFPGIQEHLRDLLFSLFLGASLVSQKPFTLRAAGQEITQSGAPNGILLQLDPGTIKTTAETVDVVSRDFSGNIVTDTKQERLNKRRKLAKLSAKHRVTDATAESILLSFDKSLNHPATELIHLFEIRDSLSKEFKGEANAKKELGITAAHWKRLGQMANHEPLNQGRHSGQHVGVLRDATENELKEAREIAIEFVIAYLEYLERNTTRTT